MTKCIRFAALVALCAVSLVSIAQAGALGGGKRTVEQVDAEMTDVYNVAFYAEQEAIVEVLGDGDTDLDLYIYDENGNLIDSDTDNTDHCVCSFTPKWTGKFVIKVKNLGTVYNEYVIRTN
jgi:hypothetical protein